MSSLIERFTDREGQVSEQAAPWNQQRLAREVYGVGYVADRNIGFHSF